MVTTLIGLTALLVTYVPAPSHGTKLPIKETKATSLHMQSKGLILVSLAIHTLIFAQYSHMYNIFSMLYNHV